MNRPWYSQYILFTMACAGTKENLNKRERQPDSTPVDKYYHTWSTKAFDETPNFNYKGPL